MSLETFQNTLSKLDDNLKQLQHFKLLLLIEKKARLTSRPQLVRETEGDAVYKSAPLLHAYKHQQILKRALNIPAKSNNQQINAEAINEKIYSDVEHYLILLTHSEELMNQALDDYEVLYSNPNAIYSSDREKVLEDLGVYANKVTHLREAFFVAINEIMPSNHALTLARIYPPYDPDNHKRDAQAAGLDGLSNNKKYRYDLDDIDLECFEAQNNAYSMNKLSLK